MTRIDDAKDMLLNLTSLEVARDIRGFSTEEERELVFHRELPAARAAELKIKVRVLQNDRNKLRADITTTTTMAELKTVWKSWINAELNPDPDEDKSRRRFRNALGKGFEIN